MTMRESSLVRRILSELNAIPETKAIKIHGDGYMEVGTPDIIGCHNGRLFAIEVKAGRGKLAPIQALRLGQWAAAGAAVSEVREGFDMRTFVEGI